MRLVLLVALAAFAVCVSGEAIEGVCGRSYIKETSWSRTFVDPEDWPWHVLVKSNITDHYFEGVLISKNLVLTVASSITNISGKPEYFTVTFNPGSKYYEQKEVEEAVIHDPFNAKYRIHDIAILKLKTDVVFNDTFQPACVWSKDRTNNLALPSHTIGSVVGYETLGPSKIKMTSPLRRINMAMVSHDKCNESKPEYYEEMNYLTEDKFCAKNQNENTICIGDTGAPFHVFIPDDPKVEYSKGAWYVRGLLHRTPVKRPPFSCNHEKYFVFTDIEKHYDWIAKHLKENE